MKYYFAPAALPPVLLSALSRLKMQVKQRTGRRAASPARRLKAAEQSKNHVFCFAIFTLQT
jgi:hypothetical protein